MEAPANAKPKIEQPKDPIKFELARNDVNAHAEERLTTKGAGAGKRTFDWKFDSDADCIKWAGEANAAGMIRTALRRWSTELINETDDDGNNISTCVDPETGEFNVDVFKDQISKFDSTGEALKDLRESLYEANLELKNFNYSKYTDQAELLAALMPITKEVQRLTAAVESKSRGPRKSVAATAKVA